MYCNKTSCIGEVCVLGYDSYESRVRTRFTVGFSCLYFALETPWTAWIFPFILRFGNTLEAWTAWIFQINSFFFSGIGNLIEFVLRVLKWQNLWH